MSLPHLPFKTNWNNKLNCNAFSTLRLRHDKRNMPQQMIRLSSGQWQHLNRYTWEQAHGPIPAGIAIVHINGNSLDNSLANLKAVTRKELAIYNRQIKVFDTDLLNTFNSINHLKKKLCQKSRQIKEALN